MCCKGASPHDACGWLDASKILLFLTKFSCFLHSTCLRVHVQWLIHACGPRSLATHSHPHRARLTSSFCINTKCLYAFILDNNYQGGGLLNLSSSTLGLQPACSIFPAVSVCVTVCQSALFRLALGGQPFSISNDVPRKSVSRATRVPNTLPAASGWCILCLHFSYLWEDGGCSKLTMMGTEKHIG